MSDNSKLIIKGGTLVNHDYISKADILIEDGKISKIDTDIANDGCQVINANGHYVFPGGVDVETYFNAERGGVKSLETYSSGTKSAIYGGTTTVVNCIEILSDEDLKTKLETEWKMITEESYCNVALQCCMPDLSGERCSQLLELLSKVNDNEKDTIKVVPMIRLSTVNKGSHMIGLDDDVLYDAICWCRDNDILPSVIAENEHMIKALEKEMLTAGITGPEAHFLSRNDRTEVEAIMRVLTIAKLAHCPLHLPRIFSEQSVELVDKWRQNTHPTNRCCTRPNVVCGTNLIALTHTGDILQDSNWERAASAVTIPALKANKSHPISGCSSLIGSLGTNSIQHVSSADLAFQTRHRAAGGQSDFRLIVPGSSCAVKARLRLLWNQAVKYGELQPTRFVECTSTMPAKLCGLYPQKGSITVGSDADLVIWTDSPRCLTVNEDPDRKLVDLFKDLIGKSGPKYVIINGKVILNEEGQLKAEEIADVAHLTINRHPLKAWFDQARLQKQLEIEKDMVPVTREPYTGEVVDVNAKPDDKCILYSDLVDKDVYQRGGVPTVEKEALPPGQRVIRTSVKTAQPPGGAQSSWWG